MKRSIETALVEWKDKKNRFPLILRGARQVGKSFVIQQFGKKHFERFVSVNFEEMPEVATCFSTLNPTIIIQRISLLVQQEIVPQKTLLFLDEIQNCPEAIMALRYFKEKLPDLHVIAAGSLLEFALKNESISIPVGRVEFLYLKPLSFHEFLTALGFESLQEHLKTISLQNPLAESLHHKLISLTKQYFILGGMPAVVAEYLYE